MAGNFEAQRLALTRIKSIKKIGEIVRTHFIYSCLLADLVIQPAANFFQSSITRKISNEMSGVFKPYKDNPPIAGYAISFNKGNFNNEALEKRDTYIGNFPCYHDNDIRFSLVENIDQLCQPYIRKGKLVVSLSQLIQNKADGFLTDYLYSYTNDVKEISSIINPLKIASIERKHALIPEYLQLLIPYRISEDFEYLMRIMLLQSYSETVEELYGFPIVNALFPQYQVNSFPYEISYLDTLLFSFLINSMDPDVSFAISKMSCNELLSFKYSQRHQQFLLWYKTFILELRNKEISDYSGLLLAELLRQQNTYNIRLRDIVKDYSTARILLEEISRVGYKRNINLSISNRFIDYSGIEIFGFVSEITERFYKRFEKSLELVIKNKIEEEKRSQKMKKVNKYKISKSTIGSIGESSIGIVQASLNSNEVQQLTNELHLLKMNLQKKGLLDKDAENKINLAEKELKMGNIKEFKKILLSFSSGIINVIKEIGIEVIGGLLTNKLIS